MPVIKKNIGVPIGMHPSFGGAHEYEKFILNLLQKLSKEANFKLTLIPKDIKDIETLSVGMEVDLRIGNADVKLMPQDKQPYRDLPPDEYLRQPIIEREKPQLGLISIDTHLNRNLEAIGIDALCCLSPGFTGPLSGLPYAAPVWDLMHRRFDYPEVAANHESSYRDLMYVNMLSKSKCIFSESDAGKEDILRHYGTFISENQIKVVDILPSDYPQVTLSLNCPRSGLLKLSGTKFFLYPAQFWEHKCHKTLIAAASRLKAAGVSDFRVVFTGSYADSYRAKNYLYLRKLAAHLNVDDLIVFLGFVEKSELDYLYRNALCLLMPTAFGPSNLPPLEALARTCPVIASNAYGMKQFLPFSVPLLDFNDPELWANEMAKFLNNIDYKSAVYREQSKNLEIRSQNRALKQLSQVIEALLND